MDYNPIYNIAKICAAHKVVDVVLSPGSRNAPLTYSFTREKSIKTYTISDERSAGFIALGMAAKSRRPVVLACTSGSALYNYAPAIAEAFFQQVPLVVISADRPPEWIDQWDGQTIRQENIFASHVKKFFRCPVDLSHKDAIWQLERDINDALILATNSQPGPVHINIPFREPFYPDEESISDHEPKIITRLLTQRVVEEVDWVSLVDDWMASTNRLIVAGQAGLDNEAAEFIGKFAEEKKVPIIGDVVSNLHGLTNNISLADSFIDTISEEKKVNLKPDLLITFGKSIISKNIRLFLRKFKPRIHWHIQEEGYAPDTYQSLTKIIPSTPKKLFHSINEIASVGAPEYYNYWQDLQNNTRSRIHSSAGRAEFNEFSALMAIMDNLPLTCDIHLANSMPVRWANLYGLDHTRQQVEIFCNRGTSGIDGCTSTAVGSALKSAKTTLLITGDMAFFYDRNAFWNKYIPDNLRVIVLNNHGGGIFDIINGPSQQPEHDEYFITDQPLSPKNLAEEFGLKYYHCKSVEGLAKGLDKFWVRNGNAKILEIETDIKTNTKVYKQLKQEIRELWS